MELDFPLINSLGVACATLGAFLVWRFLTQITFVDQEAYLAGRGLLTIPNPSEQDVQQRKRAILLSKLGLAMIVLGGVLQILGNFLAA